MTAKRQKAVIVIDCPCCGERLTLRSSVTSLNRRKVRSLREKDRARARTAAQQLYAEQKCGTCREPMEAETDRRKSGLWYWNCWRCRVKKSASDMARKEQAA